MPIEDAGDMTFFLIGEDGKAVPFYGIGTAEIDDASGYAGLAFMDPNTSIEFTMNVRMKRGARDILLGRPWTNAAWRAIRWSKRQKEKQRRQRLKEGQEHEYADMGGTGGRACVQA